MLSRADIGKEFFTISKDGKCRKLTLKESKWTGEPCFSDGSEYYYISGESIYEYDDSIVKYVPVNEKRYLKLILIGLLFLFIGYAIGKNNDSRNCPAEVELTNSSIMEYNNDLRM